MTFARLLQRKLEERAAAAALEVGVRDPAGIGQAAQAGLAIGCPVDGLHNAWAEMFGAERLDRLPGSEPNGQVDAALALPDGDEVGAHRRKGSA